MLGLYILANFVFLLRAAAAWRSAWDHHRRARSQYASEDRVATAALQLIFSRAWRYLMAGAFPVSTFRCPDGLTRQARASITP